MCVSKRLGSLFSQLLYFGFNRVIDNRLARSQAVHLSVVDMCGFTDTPYLLGKYIFSGHLLLTGRHSEGVF